MALAFLLPLFTLVRGRGILRTSPCMNSAQLALYGVALRDT